MVVVQSFCLVVVASGYGGGEKGGRRRKRRDKRAESSLSNHERRRGFFLGRRQTRGRGALGSGRRTPDFHPFQRFRALETAGSFRCLSGGRPGDRPPHDGRHLSSRTFHPVVRA